MRLQAEMGLAFLFISHDIAVVERISHRTVVMCLGEIVEIGPRASIIENPQHPYMRKLKWRLDISCRRFRCEPLRPLREKVARSAG